MLLLLSYSEKGLNIADISNVMGQLGAGEIRGKVCLSVADFVEAFPQAALDQNFYRAGEKVYHIKCKLSDPRRGEEDLVHYSFIAALEYGLPYIPSRKEGIEFHTCIEDEERRSRHGQNSDVFNRGMEYLGGEMKRILPYLSLTRGKDYFVFGAPLEETSDLLEERLISGSDSAGWFERMKDVVNTA